MRRKSEVYQVQEKRGKRGWRWVENANSRTEGREEEKNKQIRKAIERNEVKKS